MPKSEDRIHELKTAIHRLRQELERASEQKQAVEDGQTAMPCMMEDLNEASANILRAKREWEATFDAISNPIFMHDKEFKIIRANRAYQNAAGMPFDKIIGRLYYEVFPMMDRPFKACMKALELQEEDEQIFLAPPVDKVFKIRVYPVLSAERAYLYSIHIMEDITRQKKAEEALKASREYANNVINSSLNMIVAVDNERKITLFNKAAEEVFGYAADEVIGKNIDMLYINPEEGLKAHKITIECGRYVQEILNRRKNGEVFTSLLSSSILKDLQGNTVGVMGISEDITERKKAEERIKQETEITSHLLMIAEATSHTTDMDRLMNQVALCTARIIGCDVYLSYLWNKETREFRPSHAYGLDNVFMPIFRTKILDERTGFIKEALERKRPMVISDFGMRNSEFKKDDSTIRTPQSAFEWLPGVNTVAAIPLIGHRGYLGFIIALYKKPREFVERDRKLIDGISSQVSVALEQAGLYRESIDRAMELSRRVEIIQTMHEIDRSILSTLEPNEILEVTSRMVSKVVSCNRITIVLVDKEKDGFRYVAGAGDDDAIKKIGFAAFDQTSAAEILKTGMPEYVANLKEIAEPLPVEEKLLEAGFLSHIRMPITVRGDVVGILTAGAKRPSAFTSEDLSTLEKLAFQVSVALENARLLTDLQGLFIGTVRTLSETIDAKSKWTRGHSDRVTKYALAIAKEMGLDEKSLKDLEIAGLLHDIGKIGTYEAILDKPGKLTDEELKLMQQHSSKGGEMLSAIKQLKGIIPAITHHHEFYDGTGYPEGLKGEAIPLMARILGVADTVDAMGADRPYRKGNPMDAIIAELKRCSGAQFDPKVVEAFLRVQAKGMGS